MPSKNRRVNLTPKPDLYDLIERDASLRHMEIATRVTQILYEHYGRVAVESKMSAELFKGSGLEGGQTKMTLDFSGGTYSTRKQSGAQSADAKGA